MTLNTLRHLQQFRFAGLLMALFCAMPALPKNVTWSKRFSLLTDLAAVLQSSRQNLLTQLFHKTPGKEDRVILRWNDCQNPTYRFNRHIQDEKIRIS